MNSTSVFFKRYTWLWETRTIQLDRGQQDRHWQGKEKGEAFYSFLLKERDVAVLLLVLKSAET